MASATIRFTPSEPPGEDVILPNAFMFNAGLSYLEVGVTPGSPDSPGNEMTSSSFTGLSWTFQSSVYAGSGGGGGVDFFGVGEEMQWDVMTGFTLNIESDQNVETDTTWGRMSQAFSVRTPTPPRRFL